MSGSVVMRESARISCSMKAAPSTWWKKAKAGCRRARSGRHSVYPTQGRDDRASAARRRTMARAHGMSPAVNPPRPWMRTTARPRWTASVLRQWLLHLHGSGQEPFYVSPQVLAAILGKTYTDLGDGVFSFTGVTLDGFDSQKAYLKNMKDKLGDAVDGDIPEADVYIALTFDDGPTGKRTAIRTA